MLSQLTSNEVVLSLVGGAAEDFRRSLGTVLARWRHLLGDSPFKVFAIEQAREWVEEIMSNLRAVEELPSDLLRIERELCDLIRAEAALSVAARIRSAKQPGETERDFATRAGVSVGTLSPLQHARGLLPSDDTAAKLEECLGIEVGSVARQVRSKCSELMAAYRQDNGKPTGRRLSDARTAAQIVSSDPKISAAVHALAELPDGPRSTLLKVIRDLAEAFER
jgi:transcriptional regulator with XRE-family HTH domain